jgi:AcrR family transcriptional regulator
MPAIEKETEERILDSARDVFHERGYDGARMQEIADRAGINKALLHYYFRSKDQLFETIFKATVSKFLPAVLQNLAGVETVSVKIHRFVSSYIDTLKANPFIAAFILHELNRNPDRVRGFIPPLVMAKMAPFLDQISREMDAGTIPKSDPRHFLVNMFSMCIFPFIANPILKSVLSMDADAYDRFLEERKSIIPATLLGLNTTHQNTRME